MEKAIEKILGQKWTKLGKQLKIIQTNPFIL